MYEELPQSPLRTLAMYEIGRLAQPPASKILCPLMAHYPLGESANKSLLNCDFPNARRMALAQLGISECPCDSCPVRVLLGFFPTTGQQ